MLVRSPVAASLVIALLALATVTGPALAQSANDKKTEDKKHEGGKETAGTRYLDFDAMTVTLFRNDQPVGVLTTQLVLQVPTEKARAVVKEAEVKLRDVMLRELFRMAEREAHNGPKVDIDLVKARMLKVTRRLIGTDTVDDILVQALLRRGG